MFHYTFTQWLLFFYIYSFFGWCFESTLVSVCKKRLINRGFMRGPFLPLYGSGAIMMLVVSKPFQKRVSLVYLSGCAGATALEYVTGVVMEALFGVRYWDYSHKRFNYKGHICLSSSLTWGGLTVIVTRYLHPMVERVVLRIPEKVEKGTTLFISTIAASDYALSFRAALDLKNVLHRLEKVNKEISHLQKRVDAFLADAGEEIQDSLEDLHLKLKNSKEYKKRLLQFKDRYKRHMILNNPLTSKRFKKVLKEIREYLEK